VSRVYRDARAVHIKLPGANRYSVNFRVAEKSVVPCAMLRDEKREKKEETRERREEKLTDDGEEHGMTYGRRRGHLTLVCARISSLRIFHL